MKIWHKPVLLQTILKSFIREKMDVFDGTLGEGGHTEAFLLAGASVHACDRDEFVLEKAKERLKTYPRLYLHHAHFKDMGAFIPKGTLFDFILFDLGVSIYHYKESVRGFSFFDDAKLDMRLDTRGSLTAYDIINDYSDEELYRVFSEYGEERRSKAIVSKLVQARQVKKIETALELANLIEAVKGRFGKIHAATQVFQALRIEVNEELKHLEKSVETAACFLKEGGCFAVITYHSLEDRIVKNVFKKFVPVKFNFNKYKDETRDEAAYELYNKKVIEASEEEIKDNPSARSAKMRALQKRYGDRHEKNKFKEE